MCEGQLAGARALHSAFTDAQLRLRQWLSASRSGFTAHALKSRRTCFGSRRRLKFMTDRDRADKDTAASSTSAQKLTQALKSLQSSDIASLLWSPQHISATSCQGAVSEQALSGRLQAVAGTPRYLHIACINRYSFPTRATHHVPVVHTPDRFTPSQ